MNVQSEVDPTHLLTILGFIAAVWALITPVSRLRLSYCISRFDVVVSVVAFVGAHYLVFAPALQELGLYYSLGPWVGGLNTASAVYLILLCLVVYFMWRARAPQVERRKAGVFRELTENLLLTRRFDELVLLAQPQLSRLIAMRKQQSVLVRWIDRLDAPRKRDLASQLLGDSSFESRGANPFYRILRAVRAWAARRDAAPQQASQTLQNFITSIDFTAHLAQSHPHFGLELLTTDEAIRFGFIQGYVHALLDTPSSRLYVELKNNQNLVVGMRLALPPENRLLRFFFADAAAVEGLGVSKAIGDSVTRRIREDRQLQDVLNGTMGFYDEVGRFRCPVNSGITMFEIMVHEGIHQGLQDHMWMHFLRHFLEKLLAVMPMAQEEHDDMEFPTPAHYLIHRVFSVCGDWIEQAEHMSLEEVPEVTRESDKFDRLFIARESIHLMGRCLKHVVGSEKLTIRFQSDLLDIALGTYSAILRGSKLSDLDEPYLRSTIVGDVFPLRPPYQENLARVLAETDLHRHLGGSEFEKRLTAVIAGR